VSRRARQAAAIAAAAGAAGRRVASAARPNTASKPAHSHAVTASPSSGIATRPVTRVPTRLPPVEHATSLPTTRARESAAGERAARTGRIAPSSVTGGRINTVAAASAPRSSGASSRESTRDGAKKPSSAIRAAASPSSAATRPSRAAKRSEPPRSAPAPPPSSVTPISVAQVASVNPNAGASQREPSSSSAMTAAPAAAALAPVSQAFICRRGSSW
jgi:hypothetical protein